VRVVLGTGLAAAVMLRGPAGALAQPAPKAAPSAADKEAAKKLVDDGIAGQNAKDYDKAIELYQKAYQPIPHPIWLYSIGLAPKPAGRPDGAATFFERSLEREPDGDKAADARADLAAFKAAAAAKPVEPDAAPTAPPAKPDGADAPRAETADHPGR